jgi:LysR family transcriptional regulator, regulator for metE and metH
VTSIDRAALTPIASPQLDVRDLRVVMALAAAGTTAAAAELLHITQSAVSRALAVAEDHAGVELFTRTPRGLLPTAAGARVLEAAPSMLADFVALERRLREPEPRPRRLRLVAECFMAYPWLTQVILGLRKRAPGIQLDMPIEHSMGAVEALVAGQIDAALLTSRPPRELPWLDLFTDELVFLVSKAHPLAAAVSLRPRDIAEHVLLAPNARSEDGWFMREVFGARRPRLRVERLPVTEAIIELARAGLGIAVLSEWVAASYLHAPESGLRALRLQKGPLRRRWRLAHQPEVASVVPHLVAAMGAARPLRPISSA